MKSFPNFETERLFLCGVKPKDVPAYEKHFVDFEVISHLAAVVPWPYPPGGVLAYLNEFIFPYQGKNRWLWGLFLKNQPDELIGAVDLWREGNPENRGFWLGRKYWGQGLMTEAVTPVIDYAFNELGFERLVFCNAVGNIKSRRIKEKTGAKLLSIGPGEFVNPDYTEQEMWELTKEDWKLWRGSSE